MSKYNNSKKNNILDNTNTTRPLDNTADTHGADASWDTDYAWVSGVIGAAALIICAGWYKSADIMSRGLSIAGVRVTGDRTDTLLAAVLIISGVMILVEFVRLWRRHGRNFLQPSPLLEQREYGQLLLAGFWRFALNLCMFYLIVLLYHWAVVYGFQEGKRYYLPWFRVLDYLFTFYCWVGLPYTWLTLAYKHDPVADRKDPSKLILFVLECALYSGRRVLKAFDQQRHAIPQWTENHKKGLLSIIVKVFFAPLMTVFFCDQFPHLVNNLGYLYDLIFSDAARNYTHQRFNSDLFNISIGFIFSIDVALAWCGYVISSRWVGNHTQSAEPTSLGWLVCIFCYPPFQFYLGLYYGAPSEREVLNFSNQWLTTIFSTLMVLSYLLYMSATMWFGVRFSNLTNRGIIRKGPFAYVRHPAYASKNFAWWCVMFPVIVYNAFENAEIALLQTFGLCLMTWIYYMRAMTEERHLSSDPDYVTYREQVKYRFIPGVF
ncbi:MAG: hypothetical protein COA42_13475 [Alteromonadaceae bacterium]|nr:MAG: hypothetical protein COA42_13475 [Alteromonadaceae bacterium]